MPVYTPMEGQWVGDVDFDVVKRIAGAITLILVIGATATEMFIRNVLSAVQRQDLMSLEKDEHSMTSPFVS